MKVTILGAGAVGRSTAAILLNRGHAVMLWSPHGRSTASLRGGGPLVATGALTGDFFPAIADNLERAVRDADVVMMTLPCEAHRTVIETFAPFVRGGQVVIISSHCSLGAIYLAQLLAVRRVGCPIVALGTTIAYSRAEGDAGVQIWYLRDRVECATLPTSASSVGLATCEALFGKRFSPLKDVIAASLSNVNGQAHLAMVLANFTRMERGEKWHPFEYATDSVSRLAVALDAERLATAAAYQAPVQSFAEFLHFTYGVPLSPVADMFRAMHARGDDMVGPATLESRWITQDMPFIVFPMMELAKRAAVKTPLHDGALNVMSALYGRDLHAGNDLFSALEIATRSVDEIRALARGGDVTGSG